MLDAEEFISVKGFKAKGKRISTFDIETINELEPIRTAAPQQSSEAILTDDNNEVEEEEEKSDSDIIDEITGQMKLFDK